MTQKYSLNNIEMVDFWQKPVDKTIVLTGASRKQLMSILPAVFSGDPNFTVWKVNLERSGQTTVLWIYCDRERGTSFDFESNISPWSADFPRSTVEAMIGHYLDFMYAELKKVNYETSDAKTIREDVIRRLKEEHNSRDTEASHYAADEILCDLLNSLGYHDVVEDYKAIDKWYA